MTDREYMKRAIELARRGQGYTSPNPLVGAVIVKDGKIIGEGYHERYGAPHAERNALNSLSESASDATIYVTLEPCCHHGKQPPCTDAIIKSGIRRVIIGSRDPNPLVSGKGTAILRSHGITVEEDFMREECDRLNPVFFHFITTGMPYIVMKYAMTLDGKTATVTGASKWISGEASRHTVHELRHRYRGIMAGSGTVATDDPLLNCRLDGMRSPVRIICDSRLSISAESQICRTAGEYDTIIACADADAVKAEALESMGITVINVPGSDGRVNLNALMKELGSRNIDSILLEGGGTLNYSMLKENLVNELKVFIAPKIFGGRIAPSPVSGDGVNIPSEAYCFKLDGISVSGEDVLLEYIKKEGV